jgi:hypothetical protein
MYQIGEACFAFAHIWYGIIVLVFIILAKSSEGQHKFEKHVTKYFFCDRKLIFLPPERKLRLFTHSRLYGFGMGLCCCIQPTMYHVKVSTFFLLRIFCLFSTQFFNCVKVVNFC